MTRERGATVAACVALGVALGLAAWGADRITSTAAIGLAASLAGNLPGLWLAVAFACGAIARGRLMAPLAAAGALALAVAVYYAGMVTIEDQSGSYVQRQAAGWGAVALVAGPVFGFAGGTWRDGTPRLRPWALGLLAGVLLGEMLYVVAEFELLSGEPGWGPGAIIAITDVALAAALPVAMLRAWRERMTAWAIAACVSVPAAFATWSFIAEL